MVRVKVDKRVALTAEELLREAKLILQAYPDDKEIRDPLDGRRMMTKKEALERFDGDNHWASKVAGKLIGGLKFDQILRKGKRKRG